MLPASRLIFNRPCGNQMGTTFWKAAREEHGIGGSSYLRD
jgi:hypothetical protein